MRSHYETLQVSRDAEPEVIEAAYRRLARKHHPDTSSDKNANAIMRELNAAYAVLRDPRLRREYDAELASASQQNATRHPPPSPVGPPEERPASLEVASSLGRSIGGALLGLGLAIYVSQAFHAGLSFCFAAGKGGEGDWGAFFWNGHWGWRIVTSLVATSAGATVAALIGRRRGEAIGGVVGLLPSLVWAIVAYLSLTDQVMTNDFQWDLLDGTALLAHEQLGNRVAAVILAVGSVTCGFVAGKAVTPISLRLARHFDARRHSLLGIKWYHFLWIPVPGYFSLMALAYSGPFLVDFLVKNWTWGLSPMVLIPTIFLVAWYWSASLVATGMGKGYLLMAGLSEPSRGWPHTKGILKAGCGLPFLGVVLQVVLVALQTWIASLLK